MDFATWDLEFIAMVNENPKEKHRFELAFNAPLCNLLAVIRLRIRVRSSAVRAGDS